MFRRLYKLNKIHLDNENSLKEYKKDMGLYIKIIGRCGILIKCATDALKLVDQIQKDANEASKQLRNAQKHIGKL